ncbi:hypothetical protein QWJ90_01255 [Microbacterium oryzae]|uniref:hypothetical protein n=1 Tax=Microbacterium oryzae TaxID=743009 RepID=UPI0025B0A33E|nr:hypothetical protein [Microbacterium oryzae]MDN3309549.1 hypothetical protein [Microbacterium oryzae]
MAGKTRLVVVNAANYHDNFDGAAGNVSGRAMPRGGLTWGRGRQTGSNSEIVLDGSGRLRAGASGSGGAIAVVNPGSAKVTAVARIAALATSPVPALVFRAVDGDNYYGLFLRSSSTVREYSLFRRLDGQLGSVIATSGREPLVGDFLRAEVEASGRVTCYAGPAGTDELFSASMSSFPTATHVGIYADQSDVTTSFEEFRAYV